MTSARTLFLERITSLSNSAQIDAVGNKALTEKAHNDIARMLRNGLAVVGFAALEDFIKTRTSEVLSQVGTTGLPFRDLPEKLRNAATFESVSALSYQMSIRDKSDRVSYIQEHASKISSTSSTAYEITPHAFGYDQANVGHEVIKSILKSFLIDDAWGEMTKLAGRIGLVSMPLEETFKSAGIRRNRAAHVAHADTPQTDLIQFTKEAFAIAIGFDTLLSKALQLMSIHDASYLKGQKKLDASLIKIRFVKYKDTKWREVSEGSTKAIKASVDLDGLRREAHARSVKNAELYVEFNQDGNIASWMCS